MEHYKNEELRECIGFLLAMVDAASPEGMHIRGNTPDWFVAAAMMSANVEDNGKVRAIDCIREAAA